MELKTKEFFIIPLISISSKITQRLQIAKSAKQVFEDSLELVIHDNKLCISFNCVKDRKGYGSQFIPVDELEQVSAIFQDAKQNGIVSESEQLSTSEILKKSLIVTDENEVRFKTEDSKGKKPTVCSSVEDFNEFVDTFVSYLPSIQKEVSMAKAEIIKQGIELDNVKNNTSTDDVDEDLDIENEE